MVAVGCAPSASMRSYTLSANSGCPLRLHALMMVLYVRTSGLVPCKCFRSQTSPLQLRGVLTVQGVPAIRSRLITHMAWAAHLVFQGIQDFDGVVPLPRLAVHIDQDVVRHQVGLAAVLQQLLVHVQRQLQLIRLGSTSKIVRPCESP